MKNQSDTQQGGFSPYILAQMIAPGNIQQPGLYPAGNQAGDMYYGADGIRFNRLAIGSNGSLLTVASKKPSYLSPGTSGQILTISGGLPTWATPTPTGLSSKILTSTRDLTTASGDVSYTGVGFKPTSLIAMANVDGTAFISWGLADSSKTNDVMELGSTANQYFTTTAIVYLNTAAATVQSAIIKTYDTDGFTLTWTKTGSPTGTANLLFLCFK